MAAKKCKAIRGAPGLFIALERTKCRPLSQQIYEQIQNHIISDLLQPGDAIPPSRALAEQLRISRTIVVHAYEQLQAEGYIFTVRGSGTFVAIDPSRKRPGTTRRFGPTASSAIFRVKEMLAIRPGTPPPDGGGRIHYDFRHGVPAWDHVPAACWRKLLVRAWTAVGPSTLGYGFAEGSLALRCEIARLLRHTRGVTASPAQVVITTGATQALSLLSTVLLSPGDIAVVEDPTHPVLRDIFRLAGAQVVPVPVDDRGLCVRTIPTCLAEAGLKKAEDAKPRLIYVTPAHQFPSGVTMSHDRMAELLAWAAQRDAVVVEDGYDAEYRFDGSKTSALARLDADGRVIYIGSFSKVLFPALRIGYAYLPQDLVEPFLTAKWLSDRLTPTIEQEVLAEFIQSGRYAAHVRRMTRIYAARRRAMATALLGEFGERVSIKGVNAGLHMLIELDSSAREADIARAAETHGVRIYPASLYYRRAFPLHPSFLLGFGALSEKQIWAGISALARAERLGPRP